MIKQIILAITITFLLPLAVNAAEDSRVMVELPGHMKAHMLQNMRNHLVIIDQLLALISEDKFDQAADIAESELGMSSLHKHGAAHMAQFYPKGMQQAGTNMHKSASQFARTAQEGDLLDTLKALQKITASCTVCHAGYRVH